MTVNCSFIFLLRISCKIFLTWKLLSTLSLLGCQPFFSRSISLKLNSYLLVFPNIFLNSLTLLFSCLPMSRLHYLTARNLGVIFDSSLTMSEHNSSVSKSYFMFICDLHRIRNTLDSTTAKTITRSLVHSKVGYCNYLFLNLPRSQLDRFKLILNSACTILKLLDLPIINLFSNPYIGSKFITAFTTKFSQSPTKHSNLISPHICTMFSISNQTLALVLLSLSFSNAPQFPLDSK